MDQFDKIKRSLTGGMETVYGTDSLGGLASNRQTQMRNAGVGDNVENQNIKPTDDTNRTGATIKDSIQQEPSQPEEITKPVVKGGISGTTWAVIIGGVLIVGGFVYWEYFRKKS